MFAAKITQRRVRAWRILKLNFVFFVVHLLMLVKMELLVDIADFPKSIFWLFFHSCPLALPTFFNTDKALPKPDFSRNPREGVTNKGEAGPQNQEHHIDRRDFIGVFFSTCLF